MIRRHFPVRRLPDGRAFLNLGSSARVATDWNNVDFSWIMRLRRFRRLCALLNRVGLLNQHRYERILKLDPGAICWDLRRGIPFPEGTFDGVYHSHVLEHIDREEAPAFLAECFRVLKPGGVIRVVVPDFEVLARAYLEIVGRLPDHASMSEHWFAVAEMIDQMVLRTPRHRALENPVVRWMETLLLGDTSRTGILHRWMYDRYSLAEQLRNAGFGELEVKSPETSAIPGWRDFFLDTEPDGVVYKHSSLYFEGRRPQGSGAP